MTTEKLQEILSSDEQLSLAKAKDIIYELKNDCCQFNVDPYKAGYYNGEVNAFYICLDLLDKVDPHFVGIEERVAKLEAWREKLRIQNKVSSFMMSMRYGSLGDTPLDREYLQLKLNEIFGTGDYTDTDSIKQDGREAEMSFVDEAFRPNPITPENSNIRKCCPEEIK